MRNIIGLDLDGVLSDTYTVTKRFFSEKFNIKPDWNSIERYPMEEVECITKKALKAFTKSLRTGELFTEALPHNYAEHATKKLHNEGFSIAILTHRASHLKASTMDWLDEHNIVYDLVYLIDSSKKHELVKELDMKAFVEDRFDTLESIIDNHRPLELGLYGINYPYNRRWENEHIVRVDDIAQAVDRIVDYRKWKGFFLTKCQGNIEKFIKEYQDGRPNM